MPALPSNFERRKHVEGCNTRCARCQSSFISGRAERVERYCSGAAPRGQQGPQRSHCLQIIELTFLKHKCSFPVVEGDDNNHVMYLPPTPRPRPHRSRRMRASRCMPGCTSDPLWRGFFTSPCSTSLLMNLQACCGIPG